MEFAGNSLYNDVDLISYYKLENTSDNKGTNNLTNTNSVAFNAAKFNNGADYGASNTNAYLGTTTNLGFSGTSAISASMWVKVNTAIGTHALYAHYSTLSVDRYFLCYYVNDGGFQQLFIDNSGGANLGYPVNLGTSGFFHIVFMRNATQGGGSKIYLNGALGTQNSVQGATTASADQIRLGNDGHSNYASVIQDDVAIFKRILTDAEVMSIFGAGHVLTTSSKYW